jgi:hypothetical protein
MTIIPLAKEFLPLVRAGSKTSTIRRGTLRWATGPARLVSGSDQILVEITHIRHTSLGSLTEADAVKDGFASLELLVTTLGRFYPAIKSADPVSIVSFKI